MANLNRLFENDECVGILIACADFEWTVNRAVLALGYNPTKFIRENRMKDSKGHYVCGLEEYKELWKDEVKPLHKVSLTELLEKGGMGIQGVNVKKIPDYDVTVKGNVWQFLNKAFDIRSQLIHGKRNGVEHATASFMFNLLLACSGVLCDYAEENNCSIYGKRIVRLKPRELKTEV